MAISILIADDHPLIAEGVKNSLNSSVFNVVKIVDNGKKAIEYFTKHKVDIILLDLDMPVLNGIETSKKLILDYPDIKIAILSMHQEAAIIKELMQIGVKGYMLKTIPKEELNFALTKINNGEQYFNADITNALLENKSTSHSTLKKQSPLVDTLTAREKEIIKLLSEGFTNSQIGEQLFISARTVDTHRTNLMRKLDLHNVASLVRFAFQNRII